MTGRLSTVDQLRELLRRGSDAPYSIAVLTDEELIALGQTRASTPEPLPWAQATAELSDDVARLVGARSLFVRGLLTTDPARADEPVLMLDPDTRLVLDTRCVGLGYVRAVRSTTATSKIAVVQPELGAFEEDISAQGCHLFTACNYGDALSRLAAWCLPVDVGVAGGGIEVAPHDWPQLVHSELPEATATDVNVEVFLPDEAGRREPEQWLLAYGDTGALIGQPTTTDRLTVRPVGPQRLYELLAARLNAALRYAREECG